VENFINASDNFIGLGSIPRNVGVSLIRVLSGYTAGVLIAVPLGVLMGYSKTVQIIFETFINIFKPIPPLAWQPLALAIFGVSSIAAFLICLSAQIMYSGETLNRYGFFDWHGQFFPYCCQCYVWVQNVAKHLLFSPGTGASEKDIFLRSLCLRCSHIINGMRRGWRLVGLSGGAEMLPGSLAGVAIS
jgi:NitT/TauT family transport system permease protein